MTLRATYPPLLSASTTLSRLSASFSVWVPLAAITTPTLRPVSPSVFFPDALSLTSSVVQQAAAGNQTFSGDRRCNRCQSTRARHYFTRCAQSYYQGCLLNFGACNECALNGNAGNCSFYSTFRPHFSNALLLTCLQIALTALREAARPPWLRSRPPRTALVLSIPTSQALVAKRTGA